MYIPQETLSIKQWAPEDRPREKLLLKGKAALTDAELLAILLGSGTSTINAVDLAKNVMRDSGNSLFDLSRLSVNDLKKIKGIGEAKAIMVVAALELGRRKRDTDSDDRPKIINSREVYEVIRGNLLDIPHEEFWILLLNRANRVLRKHLISKGGVSGTVADPKIIFKHAIDELACGIILSHNHPSGNAFPSQSDIELTRRLKDAGKLLDIQVLDHVIVAGQKYYSFADEGML